MSRVCEICGKGPSAGRQVARSGLAKKSGGLGLHTTGVTKRRFLPNIQKIRIREKNGTVRRAKVCTACIRAGRITKA
jgi:large subunit ribosomal protein L28